MKRIFILLLILIIFKGSGICQNFKLNVIDFKYTYERNDSIVMKVCNDFADSIRLYYSLDCFYKGKWFTFDNDIFREGLREVSFLGLRSKAKSCIVFSISSLEIDEELYGLKFRLVANVLPIKSLIFKEYYSRTFVVKNHFKAE